MSALSSSGAAQSESPAELRRAALAFDDALAALDRKLKTPYVEEIEEQQELKELASLEAQVAAMEQSCTALEAQEPNDAGPELRAQRTRITIYRAELKRLRDRIRVRAQRRTGGGRGGRGRGEPATETDVMLAVAGAHRVADELIAQSVHATESLAAQRAQLEGAMEDVYSMQSLQSGLSSLMSRVQRSRAKQTLVLAFCFALGVCFFLWYSTR